MPSLGSRKLIPLFFLFLISLPIGFFALEPTYVLEVRNLDKGEVIYCREISPKDRFTLSFVHSMYGTLVYEVFEVGSVGEFVHVSTICESASAAEYFSMGFKPIHFNGSAYIIAGTGSLVKIPMLVTARSRWTLTLENRRIQLSSLVGDGDRVEVSLAKDLRVICYLRSILCGEK